MYPLMKLLIAIATAGMAMSALAMDQVNPGTLSPAMTGARPEQVASLKVDQVAAVSPLRANGSADGARFGLQVALAPSDSSALREGRSGGMPGDGSRFPAAAVPEPGEWMRLLCGLVVVAFMARRRTNPVAA